MPKILLVSFYFPPFNVAGSLRLGKLAKYLKQEGFDVKVVTASEQGAAKNIPLEIPAEDVHYVDWTDINALPKKFAGGSDKAYEITQSDEQYLSLKRRIALLLSKLYKTITNYPDSRVGWVKPAVNKCLELTDNWKPDLLYVSSLPASAAIVGYKVHKKTNIPWVCEYRDLWTLNHYYYYPSFRKYFEQRLEKKIVKTAKMVVTVSNGLANQLKNAFNVDAELLINGADFDVLDELGRTTTTKLLDSACFNIVYTGSLYKGKRNPEVVFEAISNLKKQDFFHSELPVNLHFLGKEIGYTKELGRTYNLEEEVVLHGMVDYNTAIQTQLDADALLLLLWNDPSEDGVLTSKLFEYMLAEKPIITVGRASNEAVKLVNENNLGIAGLEASDFEKYIKEIYTYKRTNRKSMQTDGSIAREFSREKLSKVMAGRLKDLIAS